MGHRKNSFKQIAMAPCEGRCEVCNKNDARQKESQQQEDKYCPYDAVGG